MGFGSWARRGIVAICLVAAIALLYSLIPKTKGSSERKPATALWSVRRIPGVVVNGVGAQRLNAKLLGVLNSDSSCVTAQINGIPVTEIRSDAPLIPASTKKLLTGLVALRVLGRDFTYQTRAVASDSPKDGTLEELFLVGSGDPVLSSPGYESVLKKDPITASDVTTPLSDLADEIVNAGVQNIPGGVVGDESRYDDERYLPSWPSTYAAGGFIGPMSALTVNDGFVGFESQKVAANNPAQAAAQTLSELLIARGVQVGSASLGTAPKSSTEVARISSPPLAQIVGAMNQSSDNLTAELITKELGAQEAGEGTTEAGNRVVERELSEIGVRSSGLVVTDGSGLDRGNQVSCAVLMQALDELLATEDKAMLAVAGQTGTLANRLTNPELSGKLYAKTGSLDGVAGLVGYLSIEPEIRFALITNGNFSESGGQTIQSRVALAVASFPNLIAAPEVVPPP